MLLDYILSALVVVFCMQPNWKLEPTMRAMTLHGRCKQKLHTLISGTIRN